MDGEDAGGVDSGIGGAGLGGVDAPIVPFFAVDLHAGGTEASVLLEREVDFVSEAVDGDAELLAGEVGGTDVGALCDVAEQERVGSRAEPEGTAVEEAIDGAGDGASVTGGGGEGEQTHAAEALGELLGGESTVRSVDAGRVPAGDGVALVKEVLERLKILVGFMHLREFPYGSRSVGTCGAWC